MFKVIIVDDHMPVINYLSASIPWESLSLQLVATAVDGKKALEACRLHQPHILIADIGMPVMNGLELIHHAMDINPHLKSIILSCHEEFEYAQRAVQLNVTDYILKESLDINQLIQRLKDIVAALSEELHYQEDYKQLMEVVEQNRSAIHTSFIRTLSEQPILNLEEWTDKAKSIGIDFALSTTFLPVLVTLERFAHLEHRFGGSHNVNFVLNNALHDLIHIDKAVLLSLNDHESIILYPFPKTIKVNLYEEIKTELISIQAAMNKYLSIRTSYFIGQPIKDLIELKRQVNEFAHYQDFRFYAKENSIVPLQKFEVSTDDIFIQYSAALHDIKDCIVHKQTTAIPSITNHWFDHIETSRYKVSAIRSWFLKIVSEIELKFTVIQHFVTNFNTEMLHHTIYSIETLEHLKEWFAQYLEHKINTVSDIQDQQVRKEIAEAKRYLLLHVDQKISMEEMAAKLKLNPTHFSRMFKAETGESFVPFVTRVKLERAKELLDQSDLSIQEIAEQLSYDNTSYFIKLFRNMTGLSPLEYRKTL